MDGSKGRNGWTGARAQRERERGQGWVGARTGVKGVRAGDG